ncbi:uncharacterized protein LOC114523853 [Dendronephthya gigantea]|uniref:uncharacterized protein LOC114523853 n=1 Tax=Dendronephthya gigantea TaxID=151771 RepID=UPI00106D609D|nr:uncharacterized protein LOC114523853 [Dendronephthya gigantea]
MFALKGFAIVVCLVALVLAVGNASKLKDLFQPRHSFETVDDRSSEDNGDFWSKFETSKGYEMDEPQCVPDIVTQCTDNAECNPMCSNFSPGICDRSKFICLPDSGLGGPSRDTNDSLTSRKRGFTTTRHKKQRV